MTSILTRPARPARPTLRRIGAEPDDLADPEDVAPPPAAPDSRPRPGAYEAATVVLRIACEILDGRRPPAHLGAHVDESVVRYWRSAAELRRGRRGSRARFARMRLCHPHPAAAEVAVAVELDGGVRAVAARFDHRDGRWRCTAMRLC